MGVQQMGVQKISDFGTFPTKINGTVFIRRPVMRRNFWHGSRNAPEAPGTRIGGGQSPGFVDLNSFLDIYFPRVRPGPPGPQAPGRPREAHKSPSQAKEGVGGSQPPPTWEFPLGLSLRFGFIVSRF